MRCLESRRSIVEDGFAGAGAKAIMSERLAAVEVRAQALCAAPAPTGGLGPRGPWAVRFCRSNPDHWEVIVAEIEQDIAYTDGPIEGVVIRPLKAFHDERGWLVEIFRHDELEQDRWPVMMYVSSTLPGVTQVPTSILTRPMASRLSALPISSSICGTHARIVPPTATGRSPLWASRTPRPWIPPGVVHAYRNVGQVSGVVFNAPNRLYAGWEKKEKVDEIRHEDADPRKFPMD